MDKLLKTLKESWRLVENVGTHRVLRLGQNPDLANKNGASPSGMILFMDEQSEKGIATGNTLYVYDVIINKVGEYERLGAGGSQEASSDAVGISEGSWNVKWYSFPASGEGKTWKANHIGTIENFEQKLMEKHKELHGERYWMSGSVEQLQTLESLIEINL
jgi:hypothetical protein